MKVELVERPREDWGEEWDRFAESHPDGRLGHASGWSVILSSAYGLEPRYLAARSQAGALVGILPLASFRPFPAGRRRLISLPFLDSAGALGSDPGVCDALIDRAVALMAAEGFSSLELREPDVVEAEAASERAMDRVNLVLPLVDSDESQWSALSAKVRNQCRKADREGLSLRAGERPALQAAFLLPYRTNMRDLGSPPHSIAFFDALSACFGDRLRYVVTEHANHSVGGLVAIRFGRRVYVPWASTLRSERNRCPNNQIYWEAIRWAISVGARELDLGRSPIDGGTYRFKKGWGAIEEPLRWRRLDPDARTALQRAGTESSIVRRLSDAWTRLPVPVATAVGSQLRRYFAN